MIRYLNRLLCLSLLCLCIDAKAQQVSLPANWEEICAVKPGKPGRWTRECRQMDIGKAVFDTTSQTLIAVLPDTQWVQIRTTPYVIVDRSKCKNRTTDGVMIEYRKCR